MQYLLTNYGGLKINKHSPRDVLASSSLAEESVEGVITTSDGLVRGHLAIRLDTMFQAVKFPTSITNLTTCLSYMYRNTFTHDESLKLVEFRDKN